MIDQTDLSDAARPGDNTKLTDWANEPPLVTLKNDLEAARPAHNAQMAQIDKWIDLLKVRGKYKPPHVKGRSSVAPKLVRRQAEWRYSGLTEPFLGSDKIYTVNPVTWEDKAAARQNEILLNWQFRTQLNVVKFIDDYVRSTVDEGTSIIQLGWVRQTKKVTRMRPVHAMYLIDSPERQEAFDQAVALKAENPRGFDEGVDDAMKAAIAYFEESGQPVYAIETGQQPVEEDEIIENQPSLEIKNPANVVIDPSCQGDINKAMFVVVSFETNKAELYKQKHRYKNLDKIDFESLSTLNTDTNHETETPQDFNLRDSTRKKVLAYEYWGYYDIRKNGTLVPIVATWIGNTLIRMEESPFPDGKLPFVLVPYLPNKRSLYGETDAEMLEDNQAISGALMRGMIDLMGRSANSQQGMAKGMLDPLNARRFSAGQDYEYNPGMDPKVNLISHTYPEIPQSAITMLTLQNQEAEALTGTKAFAGGMSGNAYGDVATGIRGVLDAASKREMAILRRLAKGMKEIGVKLIAMNSVFMTDKEVIRVTNEEYVTIKREDLKGNFDLIVDISTAEVDNQKATDLGFMLQTIGPNLDVMLMMQILAEIADLKRMPDLAQKLRTWKPAEDPRAERMKDLEMEKLAAEVRKTNSEAAMNEAKAELTKAEADLKNLEFVLKETGTDHAQKMQLQQSQSQGNQNLEVTKGLLKPPKEGEGKPDIEGAVGFNKYSDIMSGLPGGQPANPLERDLQVGTDPRLNLRSSQYDASMDPAMNPNLSM